MKNVINYKFVLVTFVAMIMMSCTQSYLIRTVKSPNKKIAKNANIGLIIDQSTLLEGLVQSSLMSRGFNVKSIAPHELIPKSLNDEIFPDESYSFMNVFTNNGGEIEVDEKHSDLILNWDDTKEAVSRLEGLSKVLESMKEKWGIDALLVASVDNNEITVKVWDSKSYTLLINHYAYVSDGKWKETLDVKPHGDYSIQNNRGKSKAPSTHEEVIIIAEHIASLLEDK